MNILQLCNKSPLPPKEGGSIAMYHLAQALITNGHSVDVLSVSTPKYNPSQIIIDEFLKSDYTYENVFINTNVTAAGAIKSFLKGEPYHIIRFIHDNFSKVLLEKLQKKKYDLVIFETLYMSPYLDVVRENSDAICMLRSHNIEHQIWKRIALNENNLLKKWYLNYLANGLKKYEIQTIGNFDLIACISDAEKEYYRSVSPGCRAELLPFGIEISVSEQNSARGSGFYHIGSMDWWPNIEGIQWLLHHVIPVLEKKCPQIRISLAGRNMPEWVRDCKSPIIEVIGEVNNATEFIESKSVLIVPLLSGSGIRIKIIEAMSVGKAVISTTTGAEGIHVTNDVDICLADEPEAFADAIIKLFHHPEKASSVGLKGMELIAVNHSYNSAYSAFEKLIEMFNRSEISTDQ